MIHIPKAQLVLGEDGLVSEHDAAEGWDSYSDRCFSQLEWWATAAKTYRKEVDPFGASPALLSTPSQRNAPSREGM